MAEPSGLDIATNSVTAAGAAAITRADVLSTIHAVDPAYRGPDTRIVLNDATLMAIKSLTVASGDDRTLWQPSMAAGEPSTIEGLPYTICQEVGDVAAGEHSLYVADMSRFIVRQAGPIRFFRLVERYADFDQTAFIAFGRFDSVLTQKSRAACILRHPAS